MMKKQLEINIGKFNLVLGAFIERKHYYRIWSTLINEYVGYTDEDGEGEYHKLVEINKKDWVCPPKYVE
jgi:hypothetical protein